MIYVLNLHPFGPCLTKRHSGYDVFRLALRTVDGRVGIGRHMRMISLKLSLRVLLAVGLLGCQVACAKGRTVASVVENLRARGVGSELGDPAGFEAVRLIAVKDARTLELWARKAGAPWTKLKTYPFTAYSGGLGPKLREGDGQIPEGVYEIEYLNPNSSYHLSMKVNYPNAFDRAKAKADGRTQLGGDIFIHGKAVTIGCIPIGDEAVEELFYFVATAGKAKVRVVIMPVDFRLGAASPEIAGIGWEAELYAAIRADLEKTFGE